MSMGTALTELGLQHRLSWQEVEQLLDQAGADIDQAVHDVEFDAWWNGHVMATDRVRAVYEALAPRGVAEVVA